jgi:hypothetical protein
MATQTDFGLLLSDESSDASRLQRITRELTTTLDRQRDLEARLPENDSLPGSKGDPVTIGAIVLTLIGSGGVVKSLIDVLKAYIDRQPSLKIEISRPDGSKTSVSAENLSPKQLESLHDFFKV